MSAPVSLGGSSRCGRVLGPSLDKIIKNAAWRKHSHLVSSCKSALDLLQSLSDLPNHDPDSPLLFIPAADSPLLLQPILVALDSNYSKVAEPALECAYKLFSLSLIRGEADPSSISPSLILRLLDAVCRSCSIGDEALELAVLRALLAAVRSPCLSIRGEGLANVVKTCYNVYLGGTNGTNQICAKSVLAQIVLIVFTRVEEDSMDVALRTVSVGELLEFTDKNLNEGSSIHFCQNFINEVMSAAAAEEIKLPVNVPSPDVKRENGAAADGSAIDDGVSKAVDDKGESDNGAQSLPVDAGAGAAGADASGADAAGTDAAGADADAAGADAAGDSKIREDGFLLFRNLCKLSMKFSSQDNPDDQILLRGKTLSLELIKVIMDTGGPLLRSNERQDIFHYLINSEPRSFPLFLTAVKQYLCLSLLKNSALSVMAIFQLQCSIFIILLSKFRSGLKEEIGIFFPMLILRVLENVNQPSFLQKMIVLNFLEKIFLDPQLIIDLFVNYDCDVESPNLYERKSACCMSWKLMSDNLLVSTCSNLFNDFCRTVNGLLKTALGPPPGSTTTLSAVQDITFRHESVKCLVIIIKSMGTWMDQQLRIEEAYLPKSTEIYTSIDNFSNPSGEDGSIPDYDLHTEVTSEISDAATLEQRRAYKIELQKGISLFNRKPSKGIEFLMNTKKIGGSPEEVAAFLKNTSGLNETVIGDYLGERDEFCLKVMHAYVDSFKFKAMGFGESIRYFLRGFRLPGEAQKIDRIMEKFAERYCKWGEMQDMGHKNPTRELQMSKADFIRNNRGIDDGKDLPEEYLSTIYDQIVKNEIKMNADSVPQTKQANSFNKLLGLDGILNLVTWKQAEEKPLGANGLLIRHIQEQFRAKAGKAESVYHVVTDAAILRFMVEVCWGPMLAAFSMTLDQSDDKLATSQCLQGFRYAVHVTAVMGMQTQRDAFVTSIAKFTYLHCAADMRQKNVDAVKAIIAIAIEDGNHLQECWEHILTCLSRIEHLQLLGEGAPTDASFLRESNAETDEKALKSMASYPSLKRKGSLQNPAVMAVVRGSSYDSSGRGFNTLGPVTPEQINSFISNLNLLDQIGHYELNHVFANSQMLNSEAIVAFVRALCKVAISELQSPTDPRVFSLTKIVEIAHYNMNRIRLVWSRIWNVLSDFFVSVGLFENLSVAIFVMDSLRQLAMKFLEREELANYNFQNEFLRPFVIVMQKSGSTEIRELIVRCISQMVLTRVNHVKSGWKSVFMVFTTAAADERKNVVLLAFQTMEKIVREYFPYITETETTTFTDCVRCLTTFTNSRFNSDVSLNAIAFLRYCAVKLAEDGLTCNEVKKDDDSSTVVTSEDTADVQTVYDKDDHVAFWFPLLTGLSRLTSDPRSAIRKSSLEVLFNILNDHGNLFSRVVWMDIFKSVVFPIFDGLYDRRDVNSKDDHDPETPTSGQSEGGSWDSDTSSLASQCLVDLFVRFFDVVRSQLQHLMAILTGFIRSPVQGPASTGVAALLRLAGELGSRLSDDEWAQIFVALKEAAALTLPAFMNVFRSLDHIEMSTDPQSYADIDVGSDPGFAQDDIEEDKLQTAAYVASRVKSHIAIQLLITQVAIDLYRTHLKYLSESNIGIIIEMFRTVASHAHELNCETFRLRKLQRACSTMEISDPPMVHFENESYQNYLSLLQDLIVDKPWACKDMKVESRLVEVCIEILQIYLKCTGSPSSTSENRPVGQSVLPLGAAKKEEVVARTSLLVSALQGLSGLERETFGKHVKEFFPLLVDLVRSEHSSGEVQRALSNIFTSCIGPIVM
ncbi:Brefeldin A-inhibited guanine nucleotide-exchange protein 1 [Linum perenne]